jgi:periplasmic protein TonB
MYANGFLEEKRRSPASLVAVIGLHAAALGAVIAFGTTTFLPPDRSGLKIITIRPEPPVPPPDQQPPPEQRPDQPQQHQSRLDTPAEDPPISTGPTVTGPSQPPQPPAGQAGPVRYAEVTTPRVPDPVRRAAMVDPNYRDALQPPYPRSMEQEARNGSVRIRITIGTDGRVSSIEQLSASDPAFWQVTERQARNRWRFRPATVDGRPVVSTMVMTVTFRIPDA